MTVEVFGTLSIQPYQPAGNGSWRWMSLTSFGVDIDIGEGLVIMVPAGFETDLASIPKLAQALFFLNPYEPQVVLAALVHDWLCPTQEERDNLDNPWRDRPMYPPTISAGVFYELMKSTGVSMLRRRVYYYAVVAAIKGDLW